MTQPSLTVMITSPSGVVFQGAAASVICPGEQGTFEILPLHRPLISRLRSGTVVVDGREVPIRRGAVRVAQDAVTMVVEMPER